MPPSLSEAEVVSAVSLLFIMYCMYCICTVCTAFGFPKDSAVVWVCNIYLYNLAMNVFPACFI